MAGTTVQETTRALAPEQAERIDGYVERARIAADAFRAIDDQVAVDRIVHALVVAGLEHAVELARLAMEGGAARSRKDRRTTERTSPSRVPQKRG